MPKILYEVLERDHYAMMVFMNMSPTYQQLCVAQLTRRSHIRMRERMDTVLKDIYKYGKDRGIAP